MVSFNHIITFNNNGKITDFQKSYSDNYLKTLNVFLPLNYNNKKQYHAELSAAVENTYPRQIVTVEGFKSDTDLNKYVFDLSELYRSLHSSSTRKRLGLCKIKLYSDNGRVKFESESFRI